MHGNSCTSEAGVKTRLIQDITSELFTTRSLHQAHNSHLAGVHLELAGHAVTECTDPNASIPPAKTLLDPRLNLAQCVELLTHLGHPEANTMDYPAANNF